MAKQYTHSQAFGDLKATDEALKDNLTSAQYLHTLDYFLWNAASPILDVCPNLFLNFVAKCVAHQLLAPNAKYTSGDRELLPINLFMLLSADRDRLELARDLYLNRGLTFGLVSLFLSLTKEYQDIVEGRTPLKKSQRRRRIAEIEAELGATGSLYEPVQRVSHWLDKANQWKNVIIQKYTRLTIMMAQRTYVDYQHSVDLDDVVQIYLMITSKAIDRCDPRLGVLTTFIQQWMKSARARVAAVAAASRNDSLDSLHELLGDSFEALSVEQDRTAELMQSVSYAAMLADPVGLVRNSLNIPQYMSMKHREKLSHYIS